MSFEPDRPFFVDRSDSIRLAILGPDRAKFLHNLTTNEIKRRPAGSGCETFVTNLQGKTIGYGTALIGPDEILFRTDPGGLEHVLPLFEKYGLFDEVSWEDRSATTFEVHFVGGEPVAGGTWPGPEEYRHAETTLDGQPVQIVRESPFGLPGWTIVGKRSDAGIGRILEAWKSTEGEWQEATAEQAEGLRIEAGTPAFGRDVTTENLPQEVGRDARAISFVKGCYLGQETVARLDALGHVNKSLKGLRIEGDTPPETGTMLQSAEGKPAGVITSAGISPRTGRPVALGMIRVAYPPGTALTFSPSGKAIVAEPPMFPLASRTPAG